MRPDVSVVMGVHNGERQLARTLDSILSQESVRLELVIVDDGSSDGSLEILQSYASRESRLRILQQHNHGLTHALIRACESVTAEYIARHDVGDLSDPRRLAIQKNAVEHDQELAFVSCWTEFRGPGDEPLYTVRGTGLATKPVSILAFDRKLGIVDGPTCHPSVPFRRSAYATVGGYRQAFYFGQDWDLWYRLATVGRFQMIPETLYYVRVGPESLSLRHRRLQQKFARLSSRAMRLRARGQPDDAVLEEAETLAREQRAPARNTAAKGLYFVAECLRRNRDPRAVDYLRQALAVNPFLWKAWARLAQLRSLARRS